MMRSAGRARRRDAGQTDRAERPSMIGQCRWLIRCIPGSRRRSWPPPGRRCGRRPTPSSPRFWQAVSDAALASGRAGRTAPLVVRAGLAAAPYLLRRGDWDTASILLEHAAMRDESPGTVQAVLPSLRRIAAATGTP